MFIKRDIENIIHEYIKFPVVAILGPRQSGKTTFITNTFKKHTYISFEDPELRSFASTDPKGFLKDYENDHGIILDEFQYVPHILSYIQLEVDQKQKPGYFILTGSQNFLMNEKITQSLAGRVGILTLLPFSIHELKKSKLLADRANEIIFTGGYPRIYDQHIKPSIFYSSYVHTYLERDVQLLVNIENTQTFQKFIALCAGRTGKALNIEEMATNCGISRDTVHSWLSILQASYIIFLLKPYHNNFEKRATKTPKLYFYDTGLACSLLGIKSHEDLILNPLRGQLFENFIITDLYKQYYHAGIEPKLYFWRDQNGRIEVDCVIETGSTLVSIEIKSGETIRDDYFDALETWNEFSYTKPQDNYVIYGGEQLQTRKMGKIIGWQRAGSLVHDIEKRD